MFYFCFLFRTPHKPWYKTWKIAVYVSSWPLTNFCSFCTYTYFVKHGWLWEKPNAQSPTLVVKTSHQILNLFISCQSSDLNRRHVLLCFKECKDTSRENILLLKKTKRSLRSWNFHLTPTTHVFSDDVGFSLWVKCVDRSAQRRWGGPLWPGEQNTEPSHD